MINYHQLTQLFDLLTPKVEFVSAIAARLQQLQFPSDDKSWLLRRMSLGSELVTKKVGRECLAIAGVFADDFASLR